LKKTFYNINLNIAKNLKQNEILGIEIINKLSSFKLYSLMFYGEFSQTIAFSEGKYRPTCFIS
jgi:hypothetical protein